MAFRALHQLPSEAFWANEGVCQVGEKEQGHTATEDIVDKHHRSFRLKAVTGFDVGEGQGKEQNHSFCFGFRESNKLSFKRC